MQDRPKVVVTRRPPGRALALMEDAAEVVAWPHDSQMPRDRLLAAVADATALYSMLTETIDAELLETAPGLAVVSNMAVGVDNIDLVACTARRIPVGHTPDVLTETTADTAFALLLVSARRIVEGVDHVRSGKWGAWEPSLLWGNDVHSSTLGLVGLGRIGTAIARRAVGFGMKVLYTSRTRKPDVERELGVTYGSLSDVLADADHVIVATALTQQTRHIIDATALAAMKSTATLVNISRGATVDHDALADALRTGEIASAGLDVTEPEPIRADHPLVGMPNCVIIPHLGSSSRRTREAMAELAARNVLAGLAGRRLEACANPEVYDVD